MKTISQNQRSGSEQHPPFDSVTANKAKGFLERVVDRRNVLLVAWLCELTEALHSTTVKWQASDQVLIGQEDDRRLLYDTLNFIKTEYTGVLKKVLTESECLPNHQSSEKVPCTNVEDFMDPNKQVWWNGIELFTSTNRRQPTHSFDDVRDESIDLIIKQRL